MVPKGGPRRVWPPSPRVQGLNVGFWVFGFGLFGFRKFDQNTETLKLAKVGLAKVGQAHDWLKSVWPKSAMGKRGASVLDAGEGHIAECSCAKCGLDVLVGKCGICGWLCPWVRVWVGVGSVVYILFAFITTQQKII